MKNKEKSLWGNYDLCRKGRNNEFFIDGLGYVQEKKNNIKHDACNIIGSRLLIQLGIKFKFLGLLEKLSSWNTHLV